jgi:hypothetical protein
VNNSRTFQEDDENDTLLFTKAEEYVLKNHPNPDRIGCPGPATLRAFVEAPRNVELAELNGLHIMRCAECTRDLIELRRQRTRDMQSPRIRLARSIIWNWKLAGIAACLSLIAFTWSALQQRERTEEVARLSSASNNSVSMLVDLSSDGVSRGTEASAPHPILLPSRLLNLHLILPYYSPSGTYRIFLTRDKSTSSLVASAEGTATADGPHLELHVEMNLNQVQAGNYLLGTQRLGDGAPYYYPVTIN